MRKFFGLLIAVVFCLCFAGCELGDFSWRVLVPPSLGPTPITYYGVAQTLEDNDGLFVYIPEIGVCDIPTYERETITVQEGDLLLIEFYDPEEVQIMERYPAAFSKSADYMAVVDFSFSLTWGIFGISSYDSTTGRLVKEKNAPNVEEYTTTYFLTPQEKLTVYKTLVHLEMTSYPDSYNPTAGIGSDPYESLILSAKIDRIDKTITANEVALDDATSAKGERFMNACRTISDILTMTEEWKALPDYPYLYN